MKKKSLLFIINPISGVGKQKTIETLADQFLNKSLYDFSFEYTNAPKHATEISRKAAEKKVDFVVAVGGDGSVNEVGNIDVSGYDFDFTIRGFQFPLLIGYDLVPGERYGIRFHTGPTYSVLIDQKEQLIDVQDLIMKNDIWGYRLGAGVDIGVLTIELDHEWGITNIFNSDGIASRNNVVYLSVGVLF